jgi:integrase
VPKRQTIDRGIYRDKYGFEVVARVGRTQSKSKRFPLGTSLDTMRGWRDATVSDLRNAKAPTADPRSLTAAIATYLKTVPTTRPAERTALAAWQAKHGDLERRKLTPALCQQAFEAWSLTTSPQTRYYRRLMLQKLWRALDGPDVSTPVDKIKIKRAKSRQPVWVTDDQIVAVIERLANAETEILPQGGYRLHHAKTRARFVVLATTGQRPAQMKRAEPGDVQFWGDLAEGGELPAMPGIFGIWWVSAAKGGERIPVYLNADMRAAWELFIAEQAWGPYSARSFARTLRSNGWPDGVRPYNLRHAVGLTLSARGSDLADIQSHLGHTNIATTRGFYVPQLHARLQQLSTSLDGRFRPAPRPTGVGAGRGSPQK